MGALKPVHIKAEPKDVARNVIVVGDPARAELLASKLLKDVRLVNTHRGFNVYTGYYGDQSFSIAVHGIGGPSAAIVFEELFMLGARTMVRIGSAGSMVKDVKIGDVVVVSGAAYACGGAGLSGYLGNACGVTAPNPMLTSLIFEQLRSTDLRVHLGPVVSSDSFYAEDEQFVERWRRAGAIAVEMECATLFSLSWIRGFDSAAAVVVSDSLVESKEVFLTTEELSETYIKVGKAVLDALTRFSKTR